MRLFILILVLLPLKADPALESKFPEVASTQTNTELISIFFNNINKKELNDIIFEVSGEEIPAYGRPFYFLLCPAFADRHNNGRVKIEINISKENFIKFLEFILTKRININSWNMWELLLASQTYKMKSIEEGIVERIFAEIRESNAVEIYKEAHRLNQEYLMKNIKSKWIITATTRVFNGGVYMLNYSLPLITNILEILANERRCGEGWIYGFFYEWSKRLHNRGIIADKDFKHTLHPLFCLHQMPLKDILQYVYPTYIDALFLPEHLELNYTLHQMENILNVGSAYCNDGFLYQFFFNWYKNLLGKGILKEGDFQSISKYFCVKRIPFEQFLNVYKTDTIPQNTVIELLYQQIAKQNQTISQLLGIIDKLNETLINTTKLIDDKLV